MTVMLEFRPVAGRRLSDAVECFVELERGSREIAGERLYHEVLSSVHELCAAIVECEQEQMTREQIVEVLQPVREVHARSPFVQRLQKWPEGYAGDFKTVEYICNARNQAPENSIEYFCEQYALTRAIAQQHRNKVQIQAARILRAMLEKPRESKILSIACGSCPDLRSIPKLESIAGEIWLNDADRNALDFAQERLESVREKLNVVHGRVPRATLKIDPAVRPGHGGRSLRLPSREPRHLSDPRRHQAPPRAGRNVLLHQHRARQSVPAAHRVLRRLEADRAHRGGDRRLLPSRGCQARTDPCDARGDGTDVDHRDWTIASLAIVNRHAISVMRYPSSGVVSV
jgi:hypothetical protein